MCQNRAPKFLYQVRWFSEGKSTGMYKVWASKTAESYKRRYTDRLVTEIDFDKVKMSQLGELTLMQIMELI